MSWSTWESVGSLGARQFVCGFCGKNVGSNQGYRNPHTGTSIFICPSCGSPTFFDHSSNQHPGPMIGRNIEKLPEDIEHVYKEIRESVKNSSFTAAALLARKLIMHLAVSVASAKEGETFVDYLDHLKSSGFIPPNSLKWLERIRKSGNEKSHELKIGNKEEAEEILKFIELLLIFMFEFGDDSDQVEANQEDQSISST